MLVEPADVPPVIDTELDQLGPLPFPTVIGAPLETREFRIVWLAPAPRKVTFEGIFMLPLIRKVPLDSETTCPLPQLFRAF
jgi:hypothetical protein